MMAAAPRQRTISRPSLALFVAGAIVQLTLFFGCGRPFDVKTQPSLPPARYAETATVNSINISVQAIKDEDLLYDTFDANLISAGLLPVRVSLTNSGGEPIDISETRFEVQAGSQRYKAVDARKAFKRLVSYYDVSAYTKAGYKDSQDAFIAYSLDIKSPLNGNQSRQGLVFVMMPEDVARQTGLKMVVSKLAKNVSRKQNIELQLN
jgi:hypothetical protein